MVFKDNDKYSDVKIMGMSNHKLHKELAERMPKIDSKPRDWGKEIENPVIFGVMEEPMHAIKHLIVAKGNGSVIIFSYEPEGKERVEVFNSKEKLESFINVLKQASDEVFSDEN